MPDKRPLFGPRCDTYGQRTHSPLNCLVFVAPLLAFFHIGSAFESTALLVSADFSSMLGVFGGAAWCVPPLLVVSVLLQRHFARGGRWKVQPAVLVGMACESLLWTLPLLAVNYLCTRLTHGGAMLAASTGSTSAWPDVLAAVGAGVYEEFVFRLVLVGAGVWAFAAVFGAKHRDIGMIVVLMLAAVAFSLYHFSWRGDEKPFVWGLFVFRASAGMCLGVVYVYRGFGIAVGAHTLWNLYCVAALS
ncbi:MAG: CPBP family intramembrane metalloprotease [Planctomycetes bacterium]|nr:CPBP family intramembrane metalloprotease [Planctomycetota bacterium]